MHLPGIPRNLEGPQQPDLANIAKLYEVEGTIIPFSGRNAREPGRIPSNVFLPHPRKNLLFSGKIPLGRPRRRPETPLASTVPFVLTSRKHPTANTRINRPNSIIRRIRRFRYYPKLLSVSGIWLAIASTDLHHLSECFWISTADVFNTNNRPCVMLSWRSVSTA